MHYIRHDDTDLLSKFIIILVPLFNFIHVCVKKSPKYMVLTFVYRTSISVCTSCYGLCQPTNVCIYSLQLVGNKRYNDLTFIKLYVFFFLCIRLYVKCVGFQPNRLYVLGDTRHN